MKFLSSFIALAVLAVFAEATGLHEPIPVGRSSRHSRVARRGASNGRCRPRATPSSTPVPASTPTPSPSPSPVNTEDKDEGKNNNTNDTKGGDKGVDKGDDNYSGGTIKGLLNVKSNCGAIGATQSTTKDSGPNGSLGWLNCGLNDGGWRPQYATIDQVITAELSSAIQDPESPFKACKNFVWAFNQFGDKYGIPPIMLASFAMQESSCNPETVGGGGEQGLMQLTSDKCGGAPGGNCRDVAFNVEAGAKYFSNSLKANDGNVIVTVAKYNGWQPDMTYNDATAARWSSCCRCQNNLDYLHQFFNGWLLNIDAYKHSLGVYFNLNVCN